jgi:hypothetical protein
MYQKNISKYKKYACSRKCAQFKTEETNISRYGVKNVFQYDKIKDKIKQNNILLYKVEFNSQREDVKNKIKNEIKNRTKECKKLILEKRKKTCLKK